MKLICPECKNDVDLTSYVDIEDGVVVECDSCGMTLEIKDCESDPIKVEIVEEGK